MGTQSADTGVESQSRKPAVGEHPQSGQESNQGSPLDAGGQETDQRWSAVEQWTRDKIFRFERGTPPTRERFLGGLIAGLIGMASLVVGLGLFIVLLPVMLLETRYPTRWGGRLTRIPVMLTAIGVACLGYVVACLRGSHDSPMGTVADEGGARSTQAAGSNRWQPIPETTNAGSQQKSVPEAGCEWGCIECGTTVYSVDRPRTCTRCARDEYDLPTGVDLFTLNQPDQSDSSVLQPDPPDRSGESEQTPEQS